MTNNNSEIHDDTSNNTILRNRNHNLGISRAPLKSQAHRAPAYSRALRRIKGVVQRVVHRWNEREDREEGKEEEKRKQRRRNRRKTKNRAENRTVCEVQERQVERRMTGKHGTLKANARDEKCWEKQAMPVS